MYWIFESLFGTCLLINAVLFIPQLVKLIKVKNSDSLSLLTFLGFLVIQAITIIHGFLRKDYILAFGTMLSMISCGLVVIFILIHRYRNKHT
jgi:MtN3 and saliva related transmembrane protein